MSWHHADVTTVGCVQVLHLLLGSGAFRGARHIKHLQGIGLLLSRVTLVFIGSIMTSWSSSSSSNNCISLPGVQALHDHCWHQDFVIRSLQVSSVHHLGTDLANQSVLQLSFMSRDKIGRIVQQKSAKSGNWGWRFGVAEQSGGAFTDTNIVPAISRCNVSTETGLPSKPANLCPSHHARLFNTSSWHHAVFSNKIHCGASVTTHLMILFPRLLYKVMMQGWLQNSNGPLQFIIPSSEGSRAPCFCICLQQISFLQYWPTCPH